MKNTDFNHCILKHRRLTSFKHIFTFFGHILDFIIFAQNMDKYNFHNRPSGYIKDPREDISSVFTNFTVIYRSEDNILLKAKRHGRWWLLKGLSEEKKDDHYMRLRLRKEFEILMEAQHPLIVTAIALEDIHDFGLCIIMEYVDGITLSEWLCQKVSRKRRRIIASQLIDAVEYLHVKNIVHRDLKPQNVIVSQNGENMKLIDFGLADTDSHAIMKQPGGTFGYMSHEQANISRPDVRNDIYSLGVIFKEMKLGYGRIIRKCLKPADKRYHTVAAMREAIKRSRRWPRIITVAALTSIFIIAALVLFQYFSSLREKVSEQQKYIETLETDVGLQTAKTQAALKDIDSLSNLIDLEAERKRLIDTTVENELAKMRKIYESSDYKKHLDTLTDLRYSQLYHYPMPSMLLLEEIENFSKGLSGTFDPQTIQDIKFRLTMNIESIIKPLFTKINQLTTILELTYE